MRILLAVALTGCSLATRFDGLSGAAADGPNDAGDGGSESSAPLPTDANAATDAGAMKPRAWRQIAVDGPPARHSARFAFDTTRKRAVLYGGVPASGGSSNETWEWNGAAWSRPTLTASPTHRRGAALVYDSARHVVVVFGGLESAPLSEPWQWDGGPSWRSSGTTSTRPSIRNGAAMAYDPERNVIVIFGGQDPVATQPSGETWEWSTTAGFSKRSPATSPPARRGHFMAYDEARKRVVVYGGWSAGLVIGDLWEWDGTTWAQRTAPLVPPPRTAACGAYDSARHVVVIFGGRQNDGQTSLDDTWEWNGDTWRQGPSAPPARRTCAMTYDSARNTIVMYGGTSRRLNMTPEPLGDTWLYE